MNNNKRVLVVGSISMDLISTTSKIPNEGETVIGECFDMAPGGKGANQAVQMAKLGADVTIIGCIGYDTFGYELIKSLSDARVDTKYIIRKDNVYTGCAQITLDISEKKAANRILVLPQANRAISLEDISFLDNIIKDFDLVVLQHEISMEINCYVAKLAYENHVKVMLNPAPSADIPEEMYEYVTYICPNEHEAYDISGIKISHNKNDVNLDEVRQLTDTLIKRGFKNVLITLGSDGSAFSDGQNFIHVPCISIDEVVDTTAAGDSFIGAFCTAICKGSSILDAMTFASYTAALTVSRFGAQPSLPTIDEVISFIN